MKHCRDLPNVVRFNTTKVTKLRSLVPDAAALEATVRQYKALGNPGRLAVLSLLALDECCVCDVAHVLRMPLSTASQHLHALKRGGLIQSRREGKLVFYAPANERARELAAPVLETAE